MITLRNLTRTLDFAKINELMHFAINDKLRGDVVVMVVEQDRTLDRLSNEDYELQALLHKTGLAHEYTLIIRSHTRRLEDVIFHESVHLLQYESGRLDIDPITGWAKWEGRIFDARTPYRARPWEKEAFKGQDLLQKEWRRSKRKIK